MERLGEPLNEWRFHSEEEEHQTIKVNQAFISNDGAIIREWALDGAGIAYKSIWDVKHDLAAGNLVTILDDLCLAFKIAIMKNRVTVNLSKSSLSFQTSSRIY